MPAVKCKTNGYTGGGEALRRWIWENRTTNVQVAEITGLSVATVQAFLSGARTPSLHAALLIERETGLPPSVWVDPKDLKRPVATC